MNQAELVINLDAYRNNLQVMRDLASSAQQMAVVKANAYGHGMEVCAKAAREVGTPWLGVATPWEALELRRLGDSGRLLCWLATPGAPFAELLANDVDVTASSVSQLEEILAAGQKARVHLKVDTGLNRNGAQPGHWTELVSYAARAQSQGKVEIVGIWSHFAAADEPDHPANDLQETAFDDALSLAQEAGLTPQWVHLANSAATATRPSAHRDLVRVGIASYGINPDPLVQIEGLVPVMTARARLAHVKEAQVGDSASYGWRWTAENPTRLGLVPVGYGDGIPRAASNRGHVGFAGQKVPIRGTVCMDQFVIDVGNLEAQVGDWVTVFGPGDSGEPTAEELAQSLGTIGYEIVTRMAGRWTRVVGGG